MSMSMTMTGTEEGAKEHKNSEQDELPKITVKRRGEEDKTFDSGNVIKASEYSTIVLPKELDIDLDEIEEYLQNKKWVEESPKLKPEKFGDALHIKTKQFAGVVGLPGTETILQIAPKTIFDNIAILAYVQKINWAEKYFYYDLNNRVNTKEKGITFLDILGWMFLGELENLLKKGFLKDYVEKQENLRYLKGKLYFSKHIKKNYGKPIFYCKYNDLTMDTLHNQIILYAAYKTAIQATDKRLRTELLRYIEQLRSSITLKTLITPSQLSQIIIGRKYDHYTNILEISKIIIKEIYYGYRDKKATSTATYLMDMNKVFERLIYGLTKEILASVEQDYKVKYQDYQSTKDFISFEKGGFRGIKPDLTIWKKNEIIAVIDAKYKPKPTSPSDYYQIVIYSLFFAMLSERLEDSIFIHYSEEDSEEKDAVRKNKGTIHLNEYLKQMTEQLPNGTNNFTERYDINIHEIPLKLKTSKGGDNSLITTIKKRLKNKLKEILDLSNEVA